VPKKIGADKQRESRTLGEALGAEITRLRVDRGWSTELDVPLARKKPAGRLGG
jgi:hypothetical protein